MSPLTVELNARSEGPVVVCVPPSGIGPDIFRRWNRTLGRSTQLVGIDVEACQGSVTAAAIRERTETAAADLAYYDDRAMIVFGHSAGCYLALCLATALARRNQSRWPGATSPMAILAGPPRGPDHLLAWSARRDRQLLADLVALGHVPEHVRGRYGLADLVLSRVRADVAVAAAAAMALPAMRRPNSSSGLAEVWLGQADPVVSGLGSPPVVLDEPAARVVVFPGGHFFPFAEGSAVPSQIERRLHDARPSRPQGPGHVEPENSAEAVDVD